MNEKEYYKLPSNIRGLRKAFGESITDLALAIGVGNTAVSNYEVGERVPERDVLKRIAKHFHITEDELLHGNYATMKKMYKDEILDTQSNIDRVDKMLPVFCSQSALDNMNFRKAYELDERILKYLKQESTDIADEDIEQCFTYYSSAIEEKVIEASANKLRLIMLFGMVTCWMKPRFLEEYDSIKHSPKKMIQTLYLSAFDEIKGSEWKQQRESFLEEFELEIVLNIYRLKHSVEYADLGDYYMAFRYIFGLVRNNNSPELNSSIGYQMMCEFSMLGNEYADRLSVN